MTLLWNKHVDLLIGWLKEAILSIGEQVNGMLKILQKLI
jgi:hypothetical protein